jgi:hypothetical protein
MCMIHPITTALFVIGKQLSDQNLNEIFASQWCGKGICFNVGNGI